MRDKADGRVYKKTTDTTKCESVYYRSLQDELNAISADVAAGNYDDNLEEALKQVQVIESRAATYKIKRKIEIEKFAKAALAELDLGAEMLAIAKDDLEEIVESKKATNSLSRRTTGGLCLPGKLGENEDEDGMERFDEEVQYDMEEMEDEMDHDDDLAPVAERVGSMSLMTHGALSFRGKRE